MTPTEKAYAEAMREQDAKLAAKPDVAPVCYMRMLNGKPDWAEDCVGMLADLQIDNYDPEDGYTAEPLYAHTALLSLSAQLDVANRERNEAIQASMDDMGAKQRAEAALQVKPGVAGLVERLRHDPTASQFLKLGDLYAFLNTQRQEAADALLSLSAQLAERDNMLATMRPFFNEYALGPKARPSCLVCGRNDYKTVAVNHAELPGIVVCDTCKSAQSQLAEKEAECEGLKVDAGRYRFLRDRQDMAVHVAVLTKNGGYCPKGSECDAAIDAAIAARKP